MVKLTAGALEDLGANRYSVAKVGCRFSGTTVENPGVAEAECERLPSDSEVAGSAGRSGRELRWSSAVLIGKSWVENPGAAKVLLFVQSHQDPLTASPK